MLMNSMANGELVEKPKRSKRNGQMWLALGATLAIHAIIATLMMKSVAAPHLAPKESQSAELPKQKILYMYSKSERAAQFDQIKKNRKGDGRMTLIQLPEPSKGLSENHKEAAGTDKMIKSLLDAAIAKPHIATPSFKDFLLPLDSFIVEEGSPESPKKEASTTNEMVSLMPLAYADIKAEIDEQGRVVKTWVLKSKPENASFIQSALTTILKLNITTVGSGHLSTQSKSEKWFRVVYLMAGEEAELGSDMNAEVFELTEHELESDEIKVKRATPILPAE